MGNFNLFAKEEQCVEPDVKQTAAHHTQHTPATTHHTDMVHTTVPTPTLATTIAVPQHVLQFVLQFVPQLFVPQSHTPSPPWSQCARLSQSQELSPITRPAPSGFPALNGEPPTLPITDAAD